MKMMTYAELTWTWEYCAIILGLAGLVAIVGRYVLSRMFEKLNQKKGK